MTALLDELLGVSSHKQGDATAPEASTAPSPNSPCGDGSPSSDAQLAELCGEIEDLNTEMDACIASIGRWEEESRQRREALERELERCYAGGHASLRAEAHGPSEEGGEYRQDDLDLELQAFNALVRSSASRSASPQPLEGRGLNRLEDLELDLEASAEHMLTEAAKQAAEDEERIARLRAEVGELRSRRFPSADTLAEPDLSPSGPSAALRVRSLEDSLRSKHFDVDVDAGAMHELEGRLQDARKYLGTLEDAVEEANLSVEDEINELEQLLNECDAARAQIQPTVA